LFLEPLEGRQLLSANVPVNDPTEDGTRPYDTQSETSVVLGADNAVLVGFNDTASFLTHQFTGYAGSADGGASFSDQGTLPLNPNGDAGDPSLARDTVSGTIYFAALPFTSSQVLVFRSFDNGQSFTAPVNGAPGGAGLQDKEWIAVDNAPGDGQGNVYLVWHNLLAGNGLYLSRSTDGGDSFGPDGGTLIAPENPATVQGGWVTVGPDHAVYVFYLQQGSPERILMRRSTDLGVTFDDPVTVTLLQTTGTTGDLGLGRFRTNAYPQAVVNPANGDLYVVYDDQGSQAGDRADVFFRQSSDGGTTWGDAVRLNDDTTTNDQWQPALAVNADGSQVGVFWYDRRLDPANDLIDRFGVIGYVSDHAVVFGANRRLSDVSFPVVAGVDPAVSPTYMGEYDQVVADGSTFYVPWGDNRLPSRGHAGNNADVRLSTVSPATQFLVSAPDTATAGSPFPVTVEAVDANGDLDTGYNGTVHFASSDGDALLPDDYTFTDADQGVQTFFVTLMAEGDQTVTATDPVIGSISGGLVVTVNPDDGGPRGHPGRAGPDPALGGFMAETATSPRASPTPLLASAQAGAAVPTGPGAPGPLNAADVDLFFTATRAEDRRLAWPRPWPDRTGLHLGGDGLMGFLPTGGSLWGEGGFRALPGE
jgi:hypothetical protein